MSPDTRSRWHDEDGIALFAALLAIIILSGLAVLFVARTVTESRQSGTSRNREIAIHAAEGGADQILSQVNLSTDAAPYVTSGPSGTHVYVAGTPEEEEDWAIELALDAAADGQLLATKEGQAYGIRPVDAAGAPVDVVFGVGFVPSYDDPNARTRVVKYHIDQAFFEPGFAILAGGNLPLGGNASIVTPDCSPTDPELCDADVHVNGAVQKGASGSYVIEGRLTVAGGDCPSGGAITGGCDGVAAGTQAEEVPEITARDFYNRQNATLQGGAEWWDMCPDGTVRRPSASGPCDMSLLPEWESGGKKTNFLGWTWDAAQRRWSSSNLEAGAFYIYRADASINGTAGTTPQHVSLFIEGDPADASSTGSLKTAGNPKIRAAFPDVLFVVDRDIDMGGTGQTTLLEGGLVTAGEQINVQGTVDIDGAIIVQDREDLDQSVIHVKRSTMGINGNMILRYDRDLAIDLTGVWTITYWNEL